MIMLEDTQPGTVDTVAQVDTSAGIYSLSDLMLRQAEEIPKTSPAIFYPAPRPIPNPVRTVIESAMDRYNKGLAKHFAHHTNETTAQYFERHSRAPLTPQLLIALTRPLFDAAPVVAQLVDGFYEPPHRYSRWCHEASIDARGRFEALLLYRHDPVHPGDLYVIQSAIIGDLWAMERTYLDRLVVGPQSKPKTVKKYESLYELNTIRLSDVQPEILDWLWEGIIPVGSLTIFAGDPSVGKSLMSKSIAARGSTGRPFIDGKPCASPFSTLLLMAEDDKSTVIVPRLMAMGADLAKIFIVESSRLKEVVDGEDDKERLVCLEQDVLLLRDTLIKHPDIKLAVIDPLSNYMGSKNMYRDQDLRCILMPLGVLARDTGVSIIVIMHNSKQSGRSALGKVGGSLGGIGAARAGWTFMKKNDGQYEMLQMKNNLGKFDGIIYTTESVQVEIDGVKTSQASMKFLGVSKVDADTAMGEADDFEGKRDNVAEALISKLVSLPDGRITSTELYTASDTVGIARRTMERAVSKLLVGSGSKNKGDRSYGWQERYKAEAASNEQPEELAFDPFS